MSKQNLAQRMNDKPNKKQRNQIYRMAKDMVQSLTSEFACNAISRAGIYYSVDEDNFPEFFLFKPRYKDCHNVWFSTHSHRLTVMDFCIEMTK